MAAKQWQGKSLFLKAIHLPYFVLFIVFLLFYVLYIGFCLRSFIHLNMAFIIHFFIRKKKHQHTESSKIMDPVKFYDKNRGGICKDCSWSICMMSMTLSMRPENLTIVAPAVMRKSLNVRHTHTHKILRRFLQMN